MGGRLLHCAQVYSTWQFGIDNCHCDCQSDLIPLLKSDKIQPYHETITAKALISDFSDTRYRVGRYQQALRTDKQVIPLLYVATNQDVLTTEVRSTESFRPTHPSVAK